MMNCSSAGNNSISSKDDAYYKRKYEKLRKTVVQMVHENAALCGEVERTEQKITKMKLERKSLIKRLLPYEKPNLESLHSTKKMVKPKRKKVLKKESSSHTHSVKNDSTSKQGNAEQVDDSLLVHPVPVDSNGRPIFPIEIGDLSVHSLGDIVSERSAFHTTDYIFPVGYCSTRLAIGIHDSNLQCLYTCKIFDAGLSPGFEISPEDDPGTIFSNRSIEMTYELFKNSVTTSLAKNSLSKLPSNAYQFFGLSLPVIQNLIQSLPGTKKCLKYEWKKFEVRSKPSSSQQDTDHMILSKPGRQSDINIEALEKWARDQ